MDKESYIRNAKKSISIKLIKDMLPKMKKLRVLAIGDTIIDDYIFVRTKGRAVKDPIMSTEYIRKETYAGGVLIAANHMSDFVDEITCVTLLGEQNTMENFVKAQMKHNVRMRQFIKKGAPTTIKQRIIDNYRNNKLFKIEYIDDSPISVVLSNEIVNYLKQELPKYDIVMVLDYGHGFINHEIRRTLEKYSNFLAVNAQSNSSNMGFNYFTHYKRADFATMDKQELRLAMQMRFENLDEVIALAAEHTGIQKFIVTTGQDGCVFHSHGELHKAPILTDKVTDTVGAGDALFAITIPFIYCGADKEIVPFIANCAGGIAVNIMGNKEAISSEQLLLFAEEALK